ncbi:NUDIX domain-containing protein [Sphingomonas rubra]|uniref:NUDIX domain-containing protein n=1 Tax=Sphingomonas rubra TaxID=634430 RepID=A0A1I5T8R1_9SPHN|nr:NUDIX domain-containing protein [Sphingomonas rubra]SFP79435.1 NUDIX domain-containing protein [Sphingomonas rubra]
MTDPIPAATLVLFRAVASGPPELLMVERSRALAFAGGASVFPGGRVDPGDHALAADDEGAARVAAIRETIEETGLAVGLHPPPAADTIAALRAGLHRGEAFQTLLTAAGLRLTPDQLVPFARWLPAHAPVRVFDTRFYLARIADDAVATVDQTENVRLCWTTAAAMLAAADAGAATIIYPTRRNLERLARFASFEEAVADAAAHPVRTITPAVERRGGIDQLCIPDDLGYPITAEPLGAAMRG